MKVLVTGGRDYQEKEIVFWALEQLEEYLHERKQEIAAVIHGDAKGADTLADQWAQENGVLQVRCPGNTKFYGFKAFGPVRNRQMLLLKPDLVVAFPGGNGTANMIATAKKHGYKVWQPTEGVSIWDFMKPYTLFDDGW